MLFNCCVIFFILFFGGTVIAIFFIELVNFAVEIRSLLLLLDEAL
jgi:hypothetical protein